MNIKLWDLPPLDKEAAVNLAKDCGIPPLLAALFMVRGFSDQEGVSRLLSRERLSDPYQMKDMDRAVARIRRALEDFEKIAIYGDYDADGVTATAILYTYLRGKNADVSFYIPQRDGEGYGMNLSAVDTLAREGVELIITVDNGISANQEIAYAKSLGIDVVVTDHHQPHEEIPEAAAVVDAHQMDDQSPFRELSGAGVALKLLIALEDGNAEAILAQYADLAAVGTVGDSVPLLGENRQIVLAGLEQINQRRRPGLDAILDLNGDGATSTKLAFSAVPCINATGRMGAPERAVRLLTYEDSQNALALAEELRGDNRRRKAVEAQLTAQACQIVEENPGLAAERILVVAGENWHHGVVGIVASRLTERYGKPCFVLSCEGDSARGSGRSVEGFSLFQAVSACKDLLERYGGHPMAAGVTLPVENIPEFARGLNRFAQLNCPEMPALTLRLDCSLKPAAINLETLAALEPLEPFGAGNAQPLFAICGVELKGVRPVGSAGIHSRLLCRRDGRSFQCVLFGVGPGDFPYPLGARIDLAVNLQLNTYRGENSVEILVRDVKLSGLDQRACLKSLRIYEKFLRQEPLSPQEAQELSPTREQLAVLYKTLPLKPGPALGAELLLSSLAPQGFTLGRLLFSLDLLRQAELIQGGVRGNFISAGRIPVESKVDIFASPMLAQLKDLQKAV
ncbi:single-stranded-DNA-specific exonuclease RecJ [Acutalibacter sp. 1XD8-33]|uniref:single-stranded-DNA-specific exonuclease RecJ n=1 Tax=Acutalibacter sp. 1XD8-33 TaxID=2320081 RepID=UPI001314C65A|nr:single-stranded-DNA-specific exonuclease RecJ [Acutalibacter sp. 1XD8-33]